MSIKGSIFIITLFILIYQVPIISDTDDYYQHINILAHDSLEGRKPGTIGDEKAANYILQQFKEAGLELLGDNGKQYFNIMMSVSPIIEETKLEIGNTKLEINSDFTPLSFSNDCKELAGNLVFVGYGFNINEDSLKWNDYQDIDVANKWVLILRGEPDYDNPKSPFLKYSEDKFKILEALDRGALGIIFVSGLTISKTDNLDFNPYDKYSSSLPILQITRNIANQILNDTNRTIKKLEEILNKYQKPISFDLTINALSSVKMKRNSVQTQNLVALQKSKKSSEYIVIGAHYDHLGMGGNGSGSLMPDTVAAHNGADDNASGVATIIELAKKLNKKIFDYNIIYVAFGGEESGLIGSKYFVENPLIDLKKIKIMLNFDMVGHLDSIENSFTIGGVSSFRNSENIIDPILVKHGLKVVYSLDGFGPSDHNSFYTENIPVLFFFTGTHDKYHTPFDDINYINFKGLSKITEFSYNLIKELANRSTKISFSQSENPIPTARRTRFNVTLGIIPDHSAQVIGLKIDGVRKNRPADYAGLQKGDIIKSIDGKPISNIYDYMNRLSELKAGQRINVEIDRNGLKKIFIVDL